MSEALKEQTSSVSIYNPLQKTISLNRKQISIESYDCATSPTMGCLEDWAEIRVTDRLMTLVVEGFKLIFKRVKINGYYAFKNTCADVSCSYCPYLTKHEDSYYDDRHNKYDEKPDWGECEDSATPFIKVDCQGSLEIKNFKIYNFRLKQSAFIEAVGPLTISDATFNNVSSAGSGDGFIVQFCGGCPTCYLDYSLNAVKYFNNGYEIRDDLQQPSFLSTTNSKHVSIKLSSFESCTVDAASTLLSFRDPKGPVKVQFVSFKYIAGSLVSVIYSGEAYQELEVNSDNFSVESATTQVELSSVVIDHVTAGVMVFVYMQNKPVSINLTSIAITNSVATMGLVYLQNLGKPSSSAISGGIETALIDGVKKAYYVRKTTCTYKAISISSSYWSDYAFKSVYMVNEELSSITVQNSGKYTGDLRDFTYKGLVEDPNSYLSVLPVIDAAVECQGTFSFERSSNLVATNLAFDGVSCSGNTGLEASVLTKVTIDIFTSLRATCAGTSLDAAALVVTSASTSSFKANLSQITVKDMKSQASGAVLVKGLDLTLEDAVFSSIVAELFSGLYCQLCTGLIIQSGVFSDLKTVTGEGACVYLSIQSAAEVRVQDSTFHQCKVNNYSGGAFFLAYSSSLVTLTLSRLAFTEGSSLQAASAIYIGSSFTLTDLSIISDCSFKGYRDQGASLIEVNIQANLSMRDCHFTDNSNRGSIVQINYSLGKFQLSLANCTFITNKSGTVISALGKDASSVLSMNNCTLSDNQAYYLRTDLVTFFDLNSTFTKGTAGMYFSSSVVNLVSTTISNLKSSDYSGIMLFEESMLQCEYCVFMHNSGKSGACIRVDSSSWIEVKHSKFSYNTGVLGSVLYLINTKLPNLIQDSEITFNYANSASTIQAFMSSLTLQRVNLHSNTAKGTPSISGQLAELTLLNCTLANQAGGGASFISVSTSTVIVKDSKIIGGLGSGIALVESNLTMSNCSVKDINSKEGSFIGSTGSSKISIRNCLVSNLTAIHEGAFITSLYGYVEISDTTLSRFNSTALVVNSASEFSVKDSVFENGSCPSYCVANLQDISSIEIIDSQFRHNQGRAALSITEKSSSVVTIKGSVFEHNSGGGALKLSVKSALVSESVFFNNTSETDGGGISALCERDSCNYTFTHNNFTLNSAKHNGGAINWLSQPSLTNNSFTNNSAAYGPDLASFGVALVNLISYTEGRLLVDSDQPVAIASGQRIPVSLRVGLVDHYGSLIKTDNQSVADILTPDDLITAATGANSVTAVMGIYEFDQIILVAKPGSQEDFKVTTSAIQSQLSDNSLTVPFMFRECKSGEAQVGNSCEVCTAGSYSLDPQQVCAKCPTGAVCYGGSLMVPKQGYWRSSKTSDEFMECLEPSVCLGSPHIVPSLTGECLRGYRGNLCQACDNGYSRSGTNKCSECPSRGGNIAKLLGLLCVVCIVSAILVRSSLMTAYEPQAQHSIYLKIFANYLQLVLLVTQLSLEWPSFVLSFFEVQNYSGSVDQQILSFECYLAGEDPQGDSYKTVYYKRLILLAVLPIIISVAVLVFWLTVFCIKKRKSILRKELVATAVVLFFLVHPILIKEYFAFFSCRPLDGSELWLTSNLDIKCLDEQHSLYAFSVALPAILLWGVGVPSFILGILVKRRRSLGTLLMKCRFGFFYNGFKKTHFYWEFLILYRKMLIISLVVFIGNQSIPIQALSIMVVLLVFIALQYWQQPYTSSMLNTMELKAILVAGITIYCGLYYLTGLISEGWRVVLFFIMVLANLYFFISLLEELLRTLLQLLATNFRLFRRFALIEDSFSAANIASANFTTSSSYLEDDKSGKIQTLCKLSKAVADVPYRGELRSLIGFFENSDPNHAYLSNEVHKEAAFTSTSLDVISTGHEKLQQNYLDF
jgi:hypothetical protein